MKEAELRSLAICGHCGNKLGEAGPFFAKVTIQRFGMKADAIKRAAGLEMMLGSVPLAKIMGPDEDLAQEVSDAQSLSLCGKCWVKQVVPAALFETASEGTDAPTTTTPEESEAL